MRFEIRRLRVGEWIVGVAALALLVILFALPWYGLSSVFSGTAATLGERINASGWQSLLILRWLVLVVAFGGLAAWWLQGTRRAPALPVCAISLVFSASFALFVALYVRVLIDQPGLPLAGATGVNPIQAKFGAYVGLALTAAIVVGAYVSLRQDASAEPAIPPVQTLRLTSRAAPLPADPRH